MKNFITIKRDVSYEEIDRFLHYSVFTFQSLAYKNGDCEVFTIPCPIRTSRFARALCDLGALN